MVAKNTVTARTQLNERALKPLARGLEGAFDSRHFLLHPSVDDRVDSYIIAEVSRRAH
jgi:hypothetical protein